MMMEFRTKIFVEKSNINISYDSKIFMIGSCFSDHISKQLYNLKFDVVSNPFGVLYNPQSIYNALELILGNRDLDDIDFVFHNGIWHSMMHHSIFSSPDFEELKNRIHNIDVRVNKFIKQADVIFITLGTAWVYKYLKNNKVVANCHKLASRNFERYKLTVGDVVSQLSELITKIRAINSSVKFVFTVSPIRHFKDGATANTVSKSTLFLAIDELLKRHVGVEYFPSYELVMDDLRDYRFYASDMVHLSQVAVDYVFSAFKDAYFDNRTIDEIKVINSIIKDFNHRPINPKSVEYLKFLKSLLGKINRANQRFPNQDWSNELNELKYRYEQYSE